MPTFKLTGEMSLDLKVETEREIFNILSYEKVGADILLGVFIIVNKSHENTQRNKALAS